MLVFPRKFSFLPNFHACFYLTIRQRGRVVYEQIVNEGEARIDYLLIDTEAELSNCFSIHSHLTKTQTVSDNETRTNETKI